MNGKKKTKLPMLPNSFIMLISFGFLGVQMAFSLQSSQMGRIFQTLGADPTKLGYFFILPPLAGLIVQPLVGYYSDRTWLGILGRRIPYLIGGAIVSIIVMILLPNSGNLGFGYRSTAALTFGAISILFMDLSSNVCMQPFKMMVGDMVNEKQKGYAYSIQSFFLNTGSVLACIFPWILTLIGIANTAKKGVVPASVTISFYVGALVLAICTFITVKNVHEYNPRKFAEYHGITEKDTHKKTSILKLLKNAPKVFWTVTLVQFFCWMAFQYLWTYGTGSVAKNVYNAIDPTSAGYQAGGNLFGILSAVYALSAVVWSLFLAKVPNNRHLPAYALSLGLGSLGFVMIFMSHSISFEVIAFVLVGISWAGMSTYPFTIVTNHLSGANMGTYLGLFNGSICLPQIIASIASFALFPIMKSMSGMLLFSGVLMAIGALCVFNIKE